MLQLTCHINKHSGVSKEDYVAPSNYSTPLLAKSLLAQVPLIAV